GLADAGTPPPAASAKAATIAPAAVAAWPAVRRLGVASAKGDPSVAHEGDRVGGVAVDARDEVQVASGRHPRGADLADQLAGADLLAHAHADAAVHEVGVPGVGAVGVVDGDVVA